MVFKPEMPPMPASLPARVKEPPTYDSVKPPKLMKMMRKKIGIIAIQHIIELPFPGKGVQLFTKDWVEIEEERLLLILATVLHPKNDKIFLMEKYKYKSNWVVQLVRWVCWEWNYHFLAKRLDNKYVSTLDATLNATLDATLDSTLNSFIHNSNLDGLS